MAKRVGILDVADAAGVSMTTVSHALSGRGQVSEATRERVRRVADELGYAPNRIASALRRQRSGIVGFVSDEIATTPFAGRVVLGAQDAAAERDLLLVVVNSNGDRDVEIRQIRALLAQQVDAIVYAKMFHQPVRLPDALGTIPTVLVDAVDVDSPAPSIVPDEQGIGELATRHLLEAGHEHIVHVTIDDPGPGHDGRIAGYREAMAQRGLKGRVVSVPGIADAAAGRAALPEVLRRAPDTTAVVCFNDQMAMGVYQVAATLGLEVPGDLSVVGVDNFEPVAAELLPGLTTVALPHYEMGRWAVAAASDLLESAVVPAPVRVRFACELVERGSVAPPRMRRVV